MRRTYTVDHGPDGKSRRMRVVDRGADGKPLRWLAVDTYNIDASKRRMTDEGFMEVPGCNINRTGIQDYGARELGIEGTNRTVRLHRPPEEVFAPDALASFEHQTLTSGHPPTAVNASNWRNYTSGDVYDCVKGEDGVHTTATLLFKDDNAIDEVVTYGRDEISCGYSFELDMTPGQFEGQAYDGVMRKIQGNHVAHVFAARGGPSLRVSDEHRSEEKSMRVIVIDGISIKVEDDTQASIIEKVITDAKAKVTAADAARTESEGKARAAEAALAAATQAATAAKTAHDAKVAELEAKVVTDEESERRTEERAKVIVDAQAIAGDKIDPKGKTIAAIRAEAIEKFLATDHASKAAVAAVLGGAEPSKAKPDITKLAFDAAVAVIAAGGTGGGQRRPGANDDAARALAPGGGKGVAGNGTARVIDYNARHARTKGQPAA